MGAFDNATVIPLFAATLKHALQGKFTLGAACICGHEGPIDAVPLAERYGQHTGLVWLEKRMRCRSCGGRGPAWVTVRRYRSDGGRYGTV